MPGIDREAYWFARHEAVYSWLAGGPLACVQAADCAADVLIDAGAGEGYGAAGLAQAGWRVLALELDVAACRHAAAAYPQVSVVRTNLAALPVRTGAAHAVVSLQVIEHLWDLPGFLRGCRRLLHPGGLVALSTPNRPVFSPGLGPGQRPTNPFHVQEFDAAQLVRLLGQAGFADVRVYGLHHGPRLAAWEAEHGSVVSAQINAALAEHGPPAEHGQSPELNVPGRTGWTPLLESFVASVTRHDFVLDDQTDAAQDLVVVGHRPESSPPAEQGDANG